MRSVPQLWVSYPSWWGSAPNWNHVARCCKKQTCAPRGGAGWGEEGEEKGGSGVCVWGGGGRQLSFSFFKRLTVIFRVLFSLFPPCQNE